MIKRPLVPSFRTLQAEARNLRAVLARLRAELRLEVERADRLRVELEKQRDAAGRLAPHRRMTRKD